VPSLPQPAPKALPRCRVKMPILRRRIGRPIQPEDPARRPDDREVSGNIDFPLLR
jgi:hypothetical protein